MITQCHLERSGGKILWRIAIDQAAVLDVLTDGPTLASARASLLAATGYDLVERRLGSFGPFDVTMRMIDDVNVAIALDGPDLDQAFRGNQTIVFYVGKTEALNALQLD